MEGLKYTNAESYHQKIKNKWKKNPEVYDHYFGKDSDMTHCRKNRNIFDRKAVYYFQKSGLPLRRNKGRCYSPDWVYSLVFIRNEEKNALKNNFRSRLKDHRFDIT